MNDVWRFDPNGISEPLGVLSGPPNVSRNSTAESSNAGPALDFILTGQKTDAAGQLVLSGTLPAIPSGTLVVSQAWILDPAGPKGLAATNGLVVKAF